MVQEHIVLNYISLYLDANSNFQSIFINVFRHSVAHSLFTVDLKLQDCIFYLRSVCEDVCGSRDGIGVGTNAISLLKCDSRRVKAMWIIENKFYRVISNHQKEHQIK